MLADPARRDAAACEDIHDSGLRADCSVVVALRAVAEGAAAERACAVVVDGPWRDECRFGAAEWMAAEARFDEAAALCNAVTSFRGACAQHLWDGPLAGVWRTPDPSWEHMLPPARALHAEWAEAFSATTDLDDRFWRHWFRYGFVATGGIPSEAASFCAEMPPDLLVACSKAVARAMADAPPGR